MYSKVIHKNKTILENAKFATSTFDISFGLMFAGNKKINRGIILKMPTDKDVKYGASVTMLFVFSKLNIIFVNKSMKVVDKVTLKPFMPSYTPKKPAYYVIESEEGTFDNIKIGDKITIENFEKKQKKIFS